MAVVEGCQPERSGALGGEFDSGSGEGGDRARTIFAGRADGQVEPAIAVVVEQGDAGAERVAGFGDAWDFGRVLAV